MRSSSRAPLVAFAAALAGLSSLASASVAHAQTTPAGFAVDRLYTSAPGAGWLVMDTVDEHGGLGGAAALTTSYARDPVVLSSGGQKLTLVSDEALVDFGFAATYDRFRLYVSFAAPLVISGSTGSLGAYSFTGPTADLASTPDSFSDARVGLDARLLGDVDGPLRLGASAQLYMPTGKRADYDSDGTYRGTLRALVAGDLGPFTYAGHVGVHVRPLDDSPTPGSPQGSELLFGVAAGARVPLGASHDLALVVGPEVFGATALRSVFGGGVTGVEGLVSARVEETGHGMLNLRFRVAGGGGLDAAFGTPEWRLVAGFEVFGHNAAAPDPVKATP